MIVRLVVGVIAGVIGALGIGLVAVGTASAQSPDVQNPGAENPDVRVLVTAASGLYELGDYGRAAQAYEDVVALGVKDTILYYNLGVTYLQAGRPALAVLNFRRALALDPSDPDTAANLDLARAQLDGVSAPAASGLTNFSDAVVGVVPAPVLGAVAVVGALAVAVLWIVFRAVRRPLRVSAIYGASVLAVFVVFAVTVIVVDSGRDATEAVLPRSVSLFSGPGTGYVDFLSVPAGVEVSVVDERDEWVRLALPPGNYGAGVEGWARRSSVDLILP